MQPIFLSFASGVAYRKIVKLHFRSISSIDQLVSISNYSTKVAKLLFLTAGNKSYCGTLQRLTHPQQSTDSPIPEPVSSSKRQVPQGKPFTLSSAPPRTSPHRHMPRATPRAIHPMTRPRQSRMQFPNRSDSAARTNTNRQDARGELHAKLLSCTTVSGRPRPEATAGPGHSHQNHRRRRCGERRQGQSKHTRTKPRPEATAGPAGPGRTTSRRARPHVSDTAPPV